MFNRLPQHRISHIADVRATNYGVVRLSLLEHIYEQMYEQKRKLGPDERNWPHRILGASEITSATPREDGSLTLSVHGVSSNSGRSADMDEELNVDLVVAATGYRRTAHVEMLREAWNLLPRADVALNEVTKEGITGWNVETKTGQRRVTVGRDYKVHFEHGRIVDGSGIWLQGCCEGTHGVGHDFEKTATVN